MMGPWSGTTIAVGLAALLIDAQPTRTDDRLPVPAAVLAAEAARIDMLGRVAQAAVAVFDRAGTGGGSAVVITADGYALTNFHVTQPLGPVLQCGMPDGRLYDAVLVGVDPAGDVALIQLLGRDDFPHAQLGDSDPLQCGDWVFAVGNPLLLAHDFQPTVTCGIVSGVHRYQYPSGTILEYTDCIQTDAAINPGNSGGPLFDAAGRLVGIVGRGSFEKRGRVNVGVGYAISINQIKNFLGHLHSGRIVDHATLGATVASDQAGRVVVVEILEQSDAYRRGLRCDDEVVALGGRDITSVNELKNILGIFPRDWPVPLTFRRAGTAHRCLVRLASLHREGELAALVQRGPRVPPLPTPDENKQPQPQESKSRGAPLQPAAMPQAVADHYLDRPGFANYYYNQLHQQRVWSACRAKADFSSLAADEWALRGHLDQGGEVLIHLAPQVAAATLPTGVWQVAFDQGLRSADDPPGSGGLLVALQAWRRFVTVGPARFGDVYYLGTMPLRDRTGLYDTLVGTCDAIKTHFLFDSKAGNLVALETYLDEAADPCELSFDDFRPVHGRLLPHRIEVQHGAAVFAVIDVDEYQIGPP